MSKIVFIGNPFEMRLLKQRINFIAAFVLILVVFVVFLTIFQPNFTLQVINRDLG